MRHIYADFIDKVAIPARYLGGEYQSVQKSPSPEMARIVLAFPDVYEIGMSHMGTKILYSILNKDPLIACERAFTPWTDMEKQMRSHKLPLVSLETQVPLSEFDVIGISLQYELTFTNVLTLLDLGGVALRSCDRSEEAPLILAGGPVATHGEPVAPFFDAFFIGEGEEKLPGLVKEWKNSRRQGLSRFDALANLAKKFPVYVPALYHSELCAETKMFVVGKPLRENVPAKVTRAMVRDINQFPFPSDTPVPYAEAVFDRAGVEIARGCTEGCRFCQAGMIYRPVRERSPESIVDSIVNGVKNAGYDETSLTSLSTADYSCITPLVKKVMATLKDQHVSLSVSSLRAYGLDEEILDEMANMRISGLTFAPEAGTQRMRDVINKNITEEHIAESARRVFKRGWHKLKLYFIIGLPTEDDDDVVGVIQTGERMLRIGREHVGKRGEVTVSVSSHVPKPHTPFQWCQQDSLPEIARKQTLLRRAVTEKGLRLKYHDRGISFVEGVLSRGDKRVADLIELVWRRGSRFDGWDEMFDLDRWKIAMTELGIDAEAYLATRPITARLPWDHIDVGLEDGFLLKEYRKATRNRLSPPCGKVIGQLVHHTNLKDAAAETKRLVCYDCGVSCDLTQMKEERLVYLRTLGAHEKGVADGRVALRTRGQATMHEDVKPVFWLRLRYAKTGRAAFLGHLDTLRVFQRLFRRANLDMAYSYGFHPKPQMTFSPALPLGVPTLGEYMDVGLLALPKPEEVLERLRSVSPEGIEFTGVWHKASNDSLGKRIVSYDLLVGFPALALGSGQAAIDSFLAESSRIVRRDEKSIDVRGLVESVRPLTARVGASLVAALDWPAEEEGLELSVARVKVLQQGSAKPSEVARALFGNEAWMKVRLARLGFAGIAPVSSPVSSGNNAFAPSLELLHREERPSA